MGWLRKKKEYNSLTLRQLVESVAQGPTRENTEAFVHRLLNSKVYALISDGNDVNTLIPKIEGPDGGLHLEVYCDLEAIKSRYPDFSVGEFTSQSVLELAHHLGVGVIVRGPREPGKAPIVGIPAKDVESLLRLAGYSSARGSLDFRVYHPGGMPRYASGARHRE